MLLAGAMVFGGGPRGAGDAIVHLLAVPVVVLAAWRWRHAQATPLQRAFLYWVIAAVLLCVAQLVPVPATVFAKFAGRAAVLRDLQAAGAAPAWLPLSLDPFATLRTLLAFATCAGMALLCLTLAPATRLRLLQLALALAVPMALLGYAQAAGGTHAPRFHAFHHPVGAIGLFANRNHYAALLGLLLPFALAFAVQAQQRRDTPRALAWYALAVGLLLAVALSFSRAGCVLAALGLAACLLLLRPARAPARVLPALAAALAALGVATYAWGGIVQRFTTDPVDDLRWQYLRYGLDAARAWLPWGSGLGSFRWAYAPFEPVAAMVRVYADRAHDDVLQVLIEAGVPGALLLAAFILLTVIAITRWPDWRDDRVKMGAASVSVALPLLHSLVDYPLRTHAVAVPWALALALLLGAKRGQAPAVHASRAG
ncbi:MAG: O-antigen ligase family protein [Lysobacteraceae bacterium]